MKKLSLEEIFDLAAVDLPKALKAAEKIEAVEITSATIKKYFAADGKNQEIVKKLLDKIVSEGTLRVLYQDRDPKLSQAARKALIKRCKQK